MVGVCVSGALRSMASRAVQQAFLHAMDALGDEECQVELMAHVAVTNLPSIGFEPSPQQVGRLPTHPTHPLTHPRPKTTPALPREEMMSSMNSHGSACSFGRSMRRWKP